MHMADALISPLVGGTILAAAAGAAVYSVNKVQNEVDDKKIPLMGVMGAFVFTAQMINFAIPGTGSSGHLGGGMLLAILLGPYAGFLTMGSVLLIQALFFGDGGLLALGCNIFNLGFYTCFIAYPFIYKRIVRKSVTAGKIFAASMLSALFGLQMGSLSVVLQTLLSGKTELHFGTFLLLMQPVHLAIGVVEGLATAAVITFVWRARPELLEKTAAGEALGSMPLKKVLIGFIIAAVLIGGVFSWYASANPDGLEWSVEKAAGTAELEAEGEVYKVLSDIQNKTALLPDYSFKTEKAEDTGLSGNAGTSVSGIVGGVLTVLLAALTGLIISYAKGRKKKAAA